MDNELSKAIEILGEGGVIIFPTDTVWGIGAWAGSKTGIAKLYRIKKRERDKPTAILVGSLEQAMHYGQFSAETILLTERYWPGALTVVVEATINVPTQVVNEWGGVGIRWPKSELIMELCKKLSGGIVASSANVAGGEPPMKLSEVAEELLVKSDYVFRQEYPLSGTSSTVVDMMTDQLKIIRQGEIVI